VRLDRKHAAAEEAAGEPFQERGVAALAEEYAVDYPEAEALVILHRRGIRFTEVPVEMRARQSGRSSIRHWRPAYYMYRVLLSVLMQICRPIPAEGERG